MTIQYALKESLVNLIIMDDGSFGIVTSSLYNGRAVFNPKTCILKLTGDINDEMVIDHYSLLEFGVKQSAMMDVDEVVSSKDFSLPRPSQFKE